MAWSREEVEATVADYLHMLTMHLAGQHYNKTNHRRQLIRLLNNRSEGAVEFKHQNISAVLIELGCPYIPGYKPRGNYQELLYDVVSDRLKDNSLFDQVALAAAQMPAAPHLPDDFSKVAVAPPTIHHSVRQPSNPRYRTANRRDYIDREARNTALGLAGEEFVVHYERWSLISRGHERLADRVEHVAKTQGDGLGYDVLSFDVTGKDELIEVKTTSFGKETPFFITRNEVELSRTEAEHFHLYRLFDFRIVPRLFKFRGAVDEHCFLDPITYQARFS
jgi:hypothetical protein